jgi:hypothetical protein
MVYRLYHAEYLGRGFYLNGSKHLPQTQSAERPFLAFHAVDAALYLCYLNLCHNTVTIWKNRNQGSGNSDLSVKYFIQIDVAGLCNLHRLAEHAQRIEGGLYHIVGIGGTQ